MKRTSIAIFLSALSMHLFAQENQAGRSSNEGLLHVDTVRISSNLEKMIFKYFHTNDPYTYQNAKAFARFEVFRWGTTEPIQRDTVDDIHTVSYEDANFDGILDIRLVTLVGMNGDNNSTCYYFYNPKRGLFEYGIGELSNPVPNSSDSTIGSSGYWSLGTGGSSLVVKLVKGEFQVIQESGRSREGSWVKRLVGNSLAVTERTSTTLISQVGDRQVFVDSSWSYLFGKLRITQVCIKVAVESSNKNPTGEEGLLQEDVMGAFVFKTEELFEYSKDANGKLVCTYTLNKASKDTLEFAATRTFSVED